MFSYPHSIMLSTILFSIVTPDLILTPETILFDIVDTCKRYWLYNILQTRYTAWPIFLAVLVV